MTQKPNSGLIMGEPTDTGTVTTVVATKPPQEKRGFFFWGIFVCLCALAFISALDVAIITTALPTVISEIGGAKDYVWIANSFVVASCVLQPLFGQTADAFGRRLPLLVAVALFILGSGIAGGATSSGMLIAARTVQGAGAGGINVLIDIICCDLVPMRERGKYLGLMFSWAGVAAALGPPVGGAIAEKNWRWIFYLNLPICGLIMLAIIFLMRVKTGNSMNDQSSGDPKSESVSGRLWRIDYLGSLIFIPSMVSLLWGVVMGGSSIGWSSWRIIVPLILGFAGWIVFHFQQTYYAKHPSVPTRLFSNRTSATGFFLTFTSSMILQAVTYFFPIYLQAVKGVTVLDSGTLFLPFAIPSLVFAATGGTLLSKFGVYRPLHAVAFGIMAIALGLFTLLNGHSSKAVYVVFELIASAGVGLIMPILLPSIMASLPERDVASSSAAYSFIRSFGFIWGVTLSGIVFNIVVDNNLGSIANSDLRQQLQHGGAYAFASQMHRLHKDGSLPRNVVDQIVSIFTKGLRAVWYVFMGTAAFSFFAVWIQKALELRTELDTEFGIDHPTNSTDTEKASS